jgi:hypothetical protein
MRRKILTIVTSACLFATGCAGLDEAYVRQDRQTYNAFGPFVDRMDSQELKDAYDAWGDRLVTAENALAGK